MIDQGKRDVLGVRVNVIDYAAAVERIVEHARQRRPFTVTALAVHGIMTGALDREHRHRLNSLDMVVPDGQPVRWALNALHRVRLADRVYGPELTLRVCERAALEDLPIYLYGGTAELLDLLKRKLTDRFPQLRIAGSSPSRFRCLSSEEREEVAEQIRSSGARIAFVGIGCPRQEVFIHEMRDLLGMPLLAVGAAFPFHAGTLAQAPGWLQSRGLEWFFRLAREPRRLWKRYVLLNPLYLGLLFMQAFRIHRIDPDDAVRPRREVRPG